MILILGGTTEGRIAIRTLEEAGAPFYYSTKGDEQEVTLHNGIRLQGAMDSTGLTAFCRQHGICLLIDAAHPFAEQLHTTVAQAAEELHLPVIRYERIFPERDEQHITWCDGYEDAIRRIGETPVHSLLALTGVQSIQHLQALWQPGQVHCRFRILDRDSSREVARQQHFPEASLCYYHPGEDERILLQQLMPDAILLKESGTSGGFVEKVHAARELGIRIFALRRPDMPKSFHCVNGEHGLRRKVEQLLPEFYPLHSGLTTGTCATAAAVAAVWQLYHPHADSCPAEFPVILPNGETIQVGVEKTTMYPDADTPTAAASVIKNAGDDPDITNGMRICATVSMDVSGTGQATASGYSLLLAGGEGIGTVTIPGLGLEVGGPAINASPRRMIEENVRHCLQSLHVLPPPSPYRITLSVPGGEEIARRTFNPRLGIEGGISIIGTSGIVKPFSTEAFIHSIRKSMEVARATGSMRVVISSGAKSERYIRTCYPDLPAQAFVHYGNFIGETLKITAELGIPRVTLGVMIGKAVKLAEGSLDTHSKKVTMNKAFIREAALQCGCPPDTLTAIDSITLARELWDVIPAGHLAAFTQFILHCCHWHCAPLLPKGELTLLLISEKGEIYRDAP